MRLNARLTAEHEQMLEAIQRATGQTTSDIVRVALSRYFKAVFPPAKSPQQALVDAGFIGCGEADPDLSANYKQALGAMGEKHGHR